MKKRGGNRLCGAAPAALALAVAGAHGLDVVTTRSGDRLSGTVISLNEGKLKFETTYAGKVLIAWEEVASLQTASPATFKLADGTILAATAQPGDAAHTVVLKSGEIITTTPIAMNQVAYINPPPEITGDGVTVTGRANLGVAANRGNTDNSQIHYDVETIIRGAVNRFTIGAEGEQKEENGSETARNNRAYLKYDHFVSKKWYAYTNADVEEDRFKDLNLRTSIGLGGGRQLWETPERNLSVEGGMSYVNEDFIEEDDDSYAAGRWAARYEQYLFGGKTSFFHRQEGLFDVTDPANLTLRAQTGFRFPLIERLSATLQYDIEWRKQPPPNVKKIDHGYLMSVGYTW